MKPLAVDLCCGLGGWTSGLLAEGWDCVGFDIERHEYGSHQYPAQLVLQDILTLDGRQFRGKVSLITASPPCQNYSYMSMPWTRAKALADWYRDPCHPERIETLNALFNACVRIGKEAECPIIIENVRGAQPWVGRARWNFGSYYLFGDVPALMPHISPRSILKPQQYQRRHGTGSWFAIDMASARAGVTDPKEVRPHSGDKISGCGANVPGIGWTGFKSAGLNWSNRQLLGHHPTRKAASALLAKIPLPLARHIGAVYRPAAVSQAAVRAARSRQMAS